MSRDLTNGILLIAGALAGILALANHPTGGDLIHARDPSGQMLLNVVVHSVAIGGVALLFMGLLGLTRQLMPSDLATAAMVAYGLGAVAVISAAVVSGFVSPGVIELYRAADGTSREMYGVLLGYSGHVNQGFAKVYVVASSAAMILWSVAIIRTGRLARSVGIAGVALGTVAALALLSGHLHLDVHGFGLLTFAQSGWMIWLGVLLMRPQR